MKQPTDLNAEAAVLSAMMLNDDVAIETALSELKEEHFYSNQHKILFTCIKSLHESNQAVDIITMLNHLKRTDRLVLAGGEELLNDISDMVLSSANIEHHIELVKECYRLRELRLLAGETVDNIASMKAEEVISGWENKIIELQESNKNNFQTANEIGLSALQELNNRVETKKTIGLKLGIYEIDDMIGGFKPGQLVIIGARPAHGKSSLAFNNFLLHNLHKRILAFNLEMGANELFFRMLSARTNINSKYLAESIKFTDYEMNEILRETEHIQKGQFIINDAGSQTINSISAQAKMMKIKQGLDAIIIDYLQLMTMPKKENQNLSVAEVTRRLKILAKELHVPVVLLSQLNREVDSRKSKIPMLSDLRDSGGIEQDADIVIFTMIPKNYKPEIFKFNGIEYVKGTEEYENVALIDVAKQRNGMTGTRQVYFFGNRSIFGCMAD